MADPIGQLIMTGIGGIFLTEEEKSFIEREDVGGVILFARNYESPAQLAELVNSIQSLRNEFPLFISVDQEGGRVIRFKTHFSQFPAMARLAALNSPKLCYEAHMIMADELKACGVNLNFSPVCDILTNPANKVIGDRSFGDHFDLVSKYVTAAIRGLQANGIMGCAKHFPGHGGTLKDSHFDLPVVNTPLEDLREREFIPFLKASKARVEFMMVGHMLVECLDNKLPCSLSPHTYRTLREEIKFSKIIITDDMEMKAIVKDFSVEEAAVAALSAGADILLYQSMQKAQVALEAVKEAVKTKVLKKQEMGEKIGRIFDCKRKNLQDYAPIYIPSISNKIGSPANMAFMKKLNSRLEAKDAP